MRYGQFWSLGWSFGLRMLVAIYRLELGAFCLGSPGHRTRPTSRSIGALHGFTNGSFRPSNGSSVPVTEKGTSTEHRRHITLQLIDLHWDLFVYAPLLILRGPRTGASVPSMALPVKVSRLQMVPLCQLPTKGRLRNTEGI